MGSAESRSAGACLTFGEFTLDLDAGFLRRGVEEIRLRPKPFEVLVYLVTHHGRLVTKRELTEAVWPDTAVMDNSLAQCVVELRRALDDSAQQLIRTVSRRGYVFTAPVAAPVAKLPPPAQSDPPASDALSARWARPSRMSRHGIIAASVAVGLIAAAAAFVGRRHVASSLRPAYEQLTYFTDSAVSPALSPDGKMLAFIRSDNWFLSRDQIYVKLLPSGEPVRITNDSRMKYAPAFSPDGSHIVYSVAAWSTYTVPALGGEPTLLLANSSGITWLDQHRILFSETRPPGSIHMGLVRANVDRSDEQAVYFPKDERGMVHASYPSPDRRWTLVLEMNPTWQPCRIVPLDGRSAGRVVGPNGSCTAAAWSPDGSWMYFGAEVAGAHHLWRQRFPDGRPEQITSGPTEEEGIAVAPDGYSLITSIGMRQSAVWIHDVRGDRPLSSDGYVPSLEMSGRAGSASVFSRDGRSLFYLKSDSPDSATELWRVDVPSETSEKMLPGTPMLEFDISDDGKEVVYSVQPRGQQSQIWLGALDRHSAPRLLAASGEDAPHFGPRGQILFRSFDGANHHLEQITREGSARARVLQYPIGNLFFQSSDRRWITAITTMADGIGGTYALPVEGGLPQRICSGCPVIWAPDGRFLYVYGRQPSLGEPGTTRVFPLRPGAMLPELPSHGMRAPAGTDDPAVYAGSHLINAYGISPSPDPAVYAYIKTTMHRNLFRIPVL